MLFNKPKTYKAVMLLIDSVKPTFSKDGNEYCFLLGDDLQSGIAGFGKTGWQAALNFYKEFVEQFKEEVKPLGVTALQGAGTV